MNVRFKKSRQKSQVPTEPVISSQVSEAGLSLSDSLVGPTTQSELFGQPVALVSHFPQQDRKQRKKTLATSGLRSSGSSESVALTTSLANKLMEQLAWVGSMEYVLTWKRKVTPLGRAYFQLRALAHRTPDTESSGGLFDEVQDTSGCPNPQGNTGEHFTLQMAAGLAGWSTPQAHDGRRPGADLSSTQGGNLSRDVVTILAGWPTPVAQPANGTPEDFLRRKRESVERGSTMGICLSDLGMVAQTILAGWPGSTTPSFTASTVNRGVLNPALPRWLMGFPETWCLCSPGYRSWGILQMMLAELSAKPEEIAPAG